MRDREVDLFVLCEGRFERLPQSADGLLRNEVLPGLWLDPQAVIARDAARMFQVAMQGVASSEHHAFLARLKAKLQKVVGTFHVPFPGDLRTAHGMCLLHHFNSCSIAYRMMLTASLVASSET